MRKRSKYKPREARPDSLIYALAGVKPLSEVGDQLVKLRLKNHGAFAALTQGTATLDDYNTMLAALNMTEALMIQRIGREYVDDLIAGQTAIKEIGRRSLTLDGRFVVKGEELRALNAAMDVHDAQLDICTVNKLTKAIEIVNKTIASGKAQRVRTIQ